MRATGRRDRVIRIIEARESATLARSDGRRFCETVSLVLFATSRRDATARRGEGNSDGDRFIARPCVSRGRTENALTGMILSPISASPFFFFPLNFILFHRQTAQPSVGLKPVLPPSPIAILAFNRAPVESWK